MSDRLTQLQDAVNQLAEHFCNSIGILQQNAPPGSFVGLEKSGSKEPAVTNEETIRLFCTLITRTTSDINTLIDSLPDESSTPELQAASLVKLEEENQDAAKKLRAYVARGEEELARIQRALVDIAEAQLSARKIEDNSLDSMKAEFLRWRSYWLRHQSESLPNDALQVLIIAEETGSYPSVAVLIQILAILPVTTATNKRSFSALKYLKTCLRNTTKKVRLNGLELLYVHRDICLDFEPDIAEFSRKNQRLNFD